MPMLFFASAISGSYPDIAANDNKNIFKSTILSSLYKP